MLIKGEIMPSLKNFSQLFDKVREGDIETYNTLKLLDIGLGTTLSNSDSKETFASVLIQSPTNEMFNDLMNKTLNENGPGYLSAVLIDLFKTEYNKGSYNDFVSGEVKSLFQQAFEGSHSWAVEATYDAYKYCASIELAYESGLPNELPSLSQIYSWSYRTDSVAEKELSKSISTANQHSHIYLREWMDSNQGEKPIIFDYISRDKDEMISRIDYFENKYEDFDVNSVVGSHSLLTSLIEENNIRSAIELHEKGYIDINRPFSPEEAERVTYHANNLISRLSSYTNNETFKHSIFEELLSQESGQPLKERSEHIKKESINSFLDYVKAIDSTKFIIGDNVDKGFMASEIELLSDVKDQADFIMFNNMVRKDFEPKVKKPSFK